MTDSLFFIIPTSLIFGSIIAIGIIVWRKLSYIKKLTVVDTNSEINVNFPQKNFWVNLFSGLAPELVETFKKFKLHEYKEAWLLELEKFLRRLRLLSLRVDRLSDSWIYKIRKGYQTETETVSESVKEELPAVLKVEEKPTGEEELLRKEEQRLIIEIAKNPKDARLYDSLGDLYFKMGEFQDAKESFAAAIELDPNNSELKKKFSLSSQK